MTHENIRFKENDSFLVRHFYRKFSKIITNFFLKTSVTANKVSMFSFLITACACIFVLFSHGEITYLIITVILLQISFIFDVSDGEIARIKSQVSKFGKWFDSCLDMIKEVLLLFSSAFLYFKLTNDFSIYIYLAILLGSTVISHSFIYNLDIIYEERRKAMSNIINKVTLISKLPKTAISWTEEYFILVFSIGLLCLKIKEMYVVLFLKDVVLSLAIFYNIFPKRHKS